MPKVCTECEEKVMFLLIMFNFRTFARKWLYIIFVYKIGYIIFVILKQRDMKTMKTKSRQLSQSKQSRQAKLMIAIAVAAASYFVVWTLIGLAL